MSHKHCVFCGEELPVPRPTSWSTICTAEINTGPMDTAGNRHHAFLVGRNSNQSVSTTAIGSKSQAIGYEEAVPEEAELRDVNAEWKQEYPNLWLLKVSQKHGNNTVTILWLTRTQAEYVAQIVEKL